MLICMCYFSAILIVLGTLGITKSYISHQKISVLSQVCNLFDLVFFSSPVIETFMKSCIGHTSQCNYNYRLVNTVQDIYRL